MTVELVLFMTKTDSARRKAEEELKEREERYQSLFASIIDRVCLHEMINKRNKPIDYMIIDMNPRFEEITGISRKDALGALASELYGSGEPPFLDTYSEVTRTGVPICSEIYFHPMEKIFSLSILNIGPQRFATVFQDITSRKKMEQELKDSEKQFRLTYHTTPDAVHINRLEDGLYVDINEGFTKITGYTREYVIERTPFDIKIRHK